jgi:hypothetical protein
MRVELSKLFWQYRKVIHDIHVIHSHFAFVGDHLRLCEFMRSPVSQPLANDARRARVVRSAGIVNLSGRGMLVVSVARQLGSGNPFARLLCCPLKPSGAGKGALGPLS